MTADLAAALGARAKIVAGIRRFFDSRGFVEVETPVRIEAPAPEPHIDCPETPLPGGGKMYLRASPELQMKKLLASGMDRIYQIGPCFREGESGLRHNPEFTMLEWYRKGASYRDLMEDLKALVSGLSSLSGDGGPILDMVRGRPFRRISVRDAYLRYAGWDPWEEWDGDRFDFDMAVKIEPAIAREGLVFLEDYPPQAASLSLLRGGAAERWEFYADGMELANCFSELCDPAEQERRFLAAREERAALGESDYPVDGDFLSSIGMIGAAAGAALGVDRLAMVLTGAKNIAEIRAPQ